MKGYLVFEPNYTADKQGFVPGQEYSFIGNPEKEKGFRFCKELKQCFKLGNSMHIDDRLFEIEALGNIMEVTPLSIFYATRIKVIREIPIVEILTITNSGNFNTGFLNKGDCNTGNHNTGSYNTGDFNCGNRNSGVYNDGNSNSGDGNHGHWNSGSDNFGNYNTGDNNHGKNNTGRNNRGNRNTGDYNVGIGNCGDSNCGDCNIGNHNEGNHNIGDFNRASYANGCFNTEGTKLFFFNRPSDWTLEDWNNSREKLVLNFVVFYGMIITDKVREVLKGIPNFDEDIFKEITGIDINNDKRIKGKALFELGDSEESTEL